MDRVTKSFEIASEIYREHGVDVSAALARLDAVVLSLNAWQGDDVRGFEAAEAHALTGGCQVTGNYPGCARNSAELRRDLELALSLIPGRQRVCLQAHQVDRMFPNVDRDGFTAEHFAGWLEWCRSRQLGLDIAPVFYSHPKLDHGLSLSHPDAEIRRFWIDHGKAVRRIAAEFGRVLGTPAVCNFWAPDGFKDTPADRLAPRQRLGEALDACFAEPFSESCLLDAVESKLFGIGTESYTVGSHDFYLMHAAQRNKLICLDTGHFHPTESIGDKLSAIIARQGRILLHVSRGVRWDSDHVIIANDELLTIGREIAFCGGAGSIHIGLDFFDASINRIAAWVIGARSMQKALLRGFLEPSREIGAAEATFDFTARLALQEEAKALPWSAVYDYYCATHDVPLGTGYIAPIRDYEKRVLLAR